MAELTNEALGKFIAENLHSCVFLSMNGEKPIKFLTGNLQGVPTFILLCAGNVAIEMEAFIRSRCSADPRSGDGSGIEFL